MLLALIALAATPASTPTLTFDERVIARVSPVFAQPIENCSNNGHWLYLEGAVSYRCPASPLHSIELSGEAPVTKELAAPLKRTLQSSAVLASVPLWRVKDVLQACKRGEKTLPSVPLTATVRCEGAEPSRVPFSVPLELECVTRRPGLREILDSVDANHNASALNVGGPGKVELIVRWSALRPTPVKATVVELNAAGEVAKRFMIVPPRKDDEAVSFEVTLDTSTERRTQLGLELKFDGSVRIRPMETVFVQPKLQGLTVFSEDISSSTDVLNRLSTAFKDPCAKPVEAAAWLRAQPGVTFAEYFDHELSFMIGRASFPVNCYSKR